MTHAPLLESLTRTALLNSKACVWRPGANDNNICEEDWWGRRQAITALCDLNRTPHQFGRLVPARRTLDRYDSATMFTRTPGAEYATQRTQATKVRSR